MRVSLALIRVLRVNCLFFRVFFGDNHDHVQCLSSLVLFLQNLVNATGSIAEFFPKSEGSKSALAVLLEKVVDELKEPAADDDDDDNRDHLQSISETLSGLASLVDSGVSGTR